MSVAADYSPYSPSKPGRFSGAWGTVSAWMASRPAFERSVVAATAVVVVLIALISICYVELLKIDSLQKKLSKSEHDGHFLSEIHIGISDIVSKVEGGFLYADATDLDTTINESETAISKFDRFAASASRDEDKSVYYKSFEIAPALDELHAAIYQTVITMRKGEFDTALDVWTARAIPRLRLFYSFIGETEEILYVVIEKQHVHMRYLRSQALQNVTIAAIIAILLTALILLFLIRSTVATVNQRRQDAEDAYQLLHKTQDALLQSEKMAALGGLVAGVAHEINTPIGIAVTGATQLRKDTDGLMKLYNSGELSAEDLQDYVEATNAVGQLVASNCDRAAKLVRSFKMIAVDQSGDDRRKFNLLEYLNEILTSLHPVIRKTPHSINVDCPADIEMDTFPGGLSQCMTNMIMNSIEHAYSDDRAGTISINARLEEAGRVEIRFTDDGNGIGEEDLAKIYDPFFTTNRANGGSGLGLSIVHNIVANTLGGTVICKSAAGEGTAFTLNLPIVRP